MKARFRFMRKIFLAAIVAGLLGCAGSPGEIPSASKGLSLTLAPKAATVLLGNDQQFEIEGGATQVQNVVWKVNGIVGGNSAWGTVSQDGLYTAPRALPTQVQARISVANGSDMTVLGEAIVTIKSDIQISIEPQPADVEFLSIGGLLNLKGMVSSQGSPDPGVEWFVNGLPGGATDVGTISVIDSGTAVYTAPSSVPSPADITIEAQSVADSNQQASLGVRITPLASSAYVALLGKFPEDNQGLSFEPLWGTFSQQPMTYALVLMSEVSHFKAIPNNDESARRIRKAVTWLMENSDLDGDQKPGWGLPDAWDAAGDGTVNPPNQPYTITTALVNLSLLDALSLPNFWSTAEQESIRTLLREVALRWCQEVWTGDSSLGYFWYSPSEFDTYFVTNVSSMFLGSLARLLSEKGDVFSSAERGLVQGRVDAAAAEVAQVVEIRDGAPFWQYLPSPNALNRTGPNDLIHHVYTLWGMELYRDLQGSVPFPWDRQDALESMDRFWRDNIIHTFPQDVTYELAVLNEAPADLWGVGMILAGYAKWGSSAHVESTFAVIEQQYGPIPDLKMRPSSFSSDQTFYHRYAAHVLWGLALRDFNGHE